MISETMQSSKIPSKNQERKRKRKEEKLRIKAANKRPKVSDSSEGKSQASQSSSECIDDVALNETTHYFEQGKTVEIFGIQFSVQACAAFGLTSLLTRQV